MFEQYIFYGIQCRTDSNHFYCFVLKVRFYTEMLVWLAGPQGFEPWVSGSEGLRVTREVTRRLIQTRLRALSRIDVRMVIKV
jgi:hypothetical protein